MVKNVNQCFLKPKMTPSNVFLYSQSKYIQFTMIRVKKQKILIYKMLLSGNIYFFSLRKGLKN